MYRKMTASLAGCVRASQAGSKLDRTQPAEGLLRFNMQTIAIYTYELIRCKRTKSHDFFIGAHGVSGTAVTAGC